MKPWLRPSRQPVLRRPPDLTDQPTLRLQVFSKTIDRLVPLSEKQLLEILAVFGLDGLS